MSFDDEQTLQAVVVLPGSKQDKAVPPKKH